MPPFLSPGMVSDPTGTQIPAEGLHHAAVPGRGLLLLLLPVVRERDGGCGQVLGQHSPEMLPFLVTLGFLSSGLCSVCLFSSLPELTDMYSWLGPRTQRSRF